MAWFEPAADGTMLFLLHPFVNTYQRTVASHEVAKKHVQGFSLMDMFDRPVASVRAETPLQRVLRVTAAVCAEATQLVWDKYPFTKALNLVYWPQLWLACHIMVHSAPMLGCTSEGDRAALRRLLCWFATQATVPSLSVTCSRQIGKTFITRLCAAFIILNCVPNGGVRRTTVNQQTRVPDRTICLFHADAGKNVETLNEIVTFVRQYSEKFGIGVEFLHLNSELADILVQHPTGTVFIQIRCSTVRAGRGMAYDMYIIDEALLLNGAQVASKIEPLALVPNRVFIYLSTPPVRADSYMQSLITRDVDKYSNSLMVVTVCRRKGCVASRDTALRCRHLVSNMPVWKGMSEITNVGNMPPELFVCEVRGWHDGTHTDGFSQAAKDKLKGTRRLLKADENVKFVLISMDPDHGTPSSEIGVTIFAVLRNIDEESHYKSDLVVIGVTGISAVGSPRDKAALLASFVTTTLSEYSQVLQRTNTPVCIHVEPNNALFQIEEYLPAIVRAVTENCSLRAYRVGPNDELQQHYPFTITTALIKYSAFLITEDMAKLGHITLAPKLPVNRFDRWIMSPFPAGEPHKVFTQIDNVKVSSAQSGIATVSGKDHQSIDDVAVSMIIGVYMAYMIANTENAVRLVRLTPAKYSLEKSFSIDDLNATTRAHAAASAPSAAAGDKRRLEPARPAKRVC